MKYIVIFISYLINAVFFTLFVIIAFIAVIFSYIWDFKRLKWGDIFYKKVQRFDGQYAHINKGYYYEHIPDKNVKETIKQWRGKQ